MRPGGPLPPGTSGISPETAPERGPEPPARVLGLEGDPWAGLAALGGALDPGERAAARGEVARGDRRALRLGERGPAGRAGPRGRAGDDAPISVPPYGRAGGGAAAGGRGRGGGRHGQHRARWDPAARGPGRPHRAQRGGWAGPSRRARREAGPIDRPVLGLLGDGAATNGVQALHGRAITGPRGRLRESCSTGSTEFRRTTWTNDRQCFGAP